MVRKLWLAFLLLGIAPVFAGSGGNITVAGYGLAPLPELAIITIDEVLAPGVNRMEIDVEFGLGEISLERGNPAKAVTGYLQYDEEYIRPEVDYSVRAGVARFSLATESRRGGWEGLRIPDMESPESELYFTTRVPMEVNFSCGLGEANLDLGELQVTNLNLENGLGETVLDFSAPNGVELRRIDVDNGLGKLTASNLSNSRAEELRFDCGLGSAELDFSGETLRDMSVDVTIGLGSVTMLIPRGFNVEMQAEENFLSSIDTRDMVIRGGGRYQSENFDSRKPTLRITASVGMGSININWTD